MVYTLLRLGSINSIFSSRISIMGEVIKFPNAKERVGKKYRQEEIARISEMMRLCDDDMKTILEQIEQLQDELQNLTAEYEIMLSRLKELLEREND
jgi:predicted RNase H-like nuclease (RuvC/YqgF family)|tara:strand:+ start:554 stop:841 length:288 start_codon:yes stop_codon:yes gene_type:complete